jgi:hypothetical protein
VLKLRDHDGQLSRNTKYFLDQVEEDLEVYKYLSGYVPPLLKEEGRVIMRNNKLVFYYTLMIKEFLSGRFRTGYKFAKLLADTENIFLLSLCFVRVKLKKWANSLGV